MTQQNYRLSIHYTPDFAAAVSRRQSRKSAGDAIRGIIIGTPIAALLWVPILWGFSRLI